MDALLLDVSESDEGLGVLVPKQTGERAGRGHTYLTRVLISINCAVQVDFIPIVWYQNMNISPFDFS